MRRRFQFSLRSLLVVVTLTAMLLGVLSWLILPYKQRAAKERDLVKQVESHGGRILHRAVDAPPWLVAIGGVFGTPRSGFETVWSIEFRSASRLNRKTLSFDSSVTDAAVSVLPEFKNLRFLDLSNSRITDSGLEILSRCRRLDSLSVCGTDVDDKGLANLRSADLLWLALDATKVTDEGLAYLTDMKRLSELSLCGTRISDDGLLHIAKLTKLRKLGICDTAITDRGLWRLACLKELKSLDLKDTKVSAVSVREFQKKLPECHVIQGSVLDQPNLSRGDSGGIPDSGDTPDSGAGFRGHAPILGRIPGTRTDIGNLEKCL